MISAVLPSVKPMLAAAHIEQALRGAEILTGRKIPETGQSMSPAPCGAGALLIYFAFKAATTSSRTFLASPNSIWLFSL